MIIKIPLQKVHPLNPDGSMNDWWYEFLESLQTSVNAGTDTILAANIFARRIADSSVGQNTANSSDNILANQIFGY